MSDLQKLFEGTNGLSAEFTQKVSAIVEARVAEARTEAIKETEAVAHQERLELVESHTAAIKKIEETKIAEMAEKVDGFLNAVVEEWANNNAPAIDANIKVEAAEAFLTGLSGVLKEHGADFNPSEDARISALEARLAESERRGNEATAELNTIRESAAKGKRDEIINRICEGLVETKKQTVVGLLDGIEMVKESDFEARVRTFRGLVEGKKAKKEDDEKGDGEGDGEGEGEGLDENNVDKNGKDKPEDQPASKKSGDETGEEVNESVRSQISAFMMKG